VVKLAVAVWRGFFKKKVQNNIIIIIMFLCYVPCMFGNARKLQWDGVPGWHACAHGQAWVAVEFLLVMFCLHVHVISMWTV
jgi:hypothetical protein